MVVAGLRGMLRVRAAKPMTLSPSPTAAVSVTVTRGGVGFASEQETQVSSKPASASDIKNGFRYGRLRDRQNGGQGWALCLRRWFMDGLGLDVLKTKQPTTGLDRGGLLQWDDLWLVGLHIIMTRRGKELRRPSELTVLTRSRVLVAAEPTFGLFDQRTDSGKPIDIRREDGSILVLDSD